MKTILLTGPSGCIGRCLRLALRNDYRLVLFKRSAVGDLGPNDTLIRGDNTDAEGVERATRGVDAIVDMAGVSDVRSFREKLLPVNILGIYNVFEAARTAGVPRVVCASTDHGITYYPAGQLIDQAAPVRPDNMYAVTNCFAEATGRLYAAKTGLKVICPHIGFFQDRPFEGRHLGVWIGPARPVRRGGDWRSL
jgi:uronate dehydrogenase